MLNLKPLVSPGIGHTGQWRDAEFLVVEGNDRVGGLVELEQSFADLLFGYAAYPDDFLTGAKVKPTGLQA